MKKRQFQEDDENVTKAEPISRHMKILVTGGLGFIGSHLVDRYLALGHEVAVVDNKSRGNHSPLDERATFYHVSVTDDELAEVFRIEQPDIVSHHAAQASVRHPSPRFDARQNIEGSVNLIECSVAHGVKKIIYASSGGAVYGKPQYLPIHESHPCQPICCYGISKYTVELYLYQAQYVHGLDYTVLRYGNVYGPRQLSGIIPLMTRLLSEKKPVTIFGDGTSTRDYTFISDVVDANELALSAGSCEGYNVGTGIETSLDALFTLLREKVNPFADVPRYADANPEEAYRIALNSFKIEEEMGWVPKVAIEKGIDAWLDSLKTEGESYHILRKT